MNWLRFLLTIIGVSGLMVLAGYVAVTRYVDGLGWDRIVDRGSRPYDPSDSAGA